MNFLLHCVLARQRHSDRVALNISNSVLFWVVTKFAVCFGYSTKILSFCDLCWTCVCHTSQRSISVLQALVFFAESLMLTFIQKNPFSCAPVCSVFSSEGRALPFFKVPPNPEQKKQGGFCCTPLWKKKNPKTQTWHALSHGSHGDQQKSSQQAHVTKGGVSKFIPPAMGQWYPDSAISINYLMVNTSCISGLQLLSAHPGLWGCSSPSPHVTPQFSPPSLELGLETLGFVHPKSHALERMTFSWRWDNPSDLHLNVLNRLHITFSLGRMIISGHQLGATGSCCICPAASRSISLLLWPICV